jgi:hypothetical protein
MTVPGRDVVYCPECQKPIALPHESPLGFFQCFEEPADGLSAGVAPWPADFLCPVCGKEFSCLAATDDDLVPVMVPELLLPDLLQVEYVAVQGNSEIRKTTYTTCPKDSDPLNEVPRLLKRLSGVRQILHLHVSSYLPESCERPGASV